MRFLRNLGALAGSMATIFFAAAFVLLPYQPAAAQGISQKVADCDWFFPNACAKVGGASGTSSAGTITTHLVFQTALAASTGARRGCTIQNTSADTEWIFIGATASATTGASLKLAAGQPFYCASSGITELNNIAITSNATDGATFTLISQ